MASKNSKWKQRLRQMRNGMDQTRAKGNLFQRLYESRPAMMITSLVTAIVLWFVISIAVYPTTPRTIYRVPLQVEITGTSAEENGLSVIDYNVQEVNVQLEGNRRQVGNIDADDLTATAVIENVTTAGTKHLSIQVTSNDNTVFEVRSISPSAVDVTFDHIATETIEVRASAPNIAFAQGCVLDEENFVSTPATLDVTGPQQELDQVAYCVAETSQQETISASKIFTTDALLFYTEDGTLVDDTNFTYEVARFSLEIPVLYQKTLDITYQITNVPTGFDLDCLDLQLSEEQITLAASNASIEDMTDFNIGSVALRDIDLDYSQDFMVAVVDGFVNQSGFSAVTLTLDSTGLSKRDFVLTDIGVVNASGNYDFTVLTQQLTVSMVGPEEVLENLDASDITVNVDLLGYSAQAEAEAGTEATFNYTPTISCSKYNNVWAVGDYRVAVQGVRADATTTTTDETSETTTTETEPTDSED